MTDKDADIYICPKCGDININIFSQDFRENGKCEYCGYPMKDQIKTNYTDNIYNKRVGTDAP